MVVEYWLMELGKRQKQNGAGMAPFCIASVQASDSICVSAAARRKRPPWASHSSPATLTLAIYAADLRLSHFARPLSVLATCLKTSSKRLRASLMISGVSAMEVYRRLPARVTMPLAM